MRKNDAWRIARGVLPGIALLWIAIRLAPLAYDDAYIHLRISKHLLEWGAPYFNKGEAIMGSSSPLWTLVLTLPLLVEKLTGVSVLVPLAALNATLTILAVWAWTRLARDLSGGKISPMATTLLAAAYLGSLLPACCGLMETPLAMALLGLGVLAVWRERSVGWVLLALATLTRIELVVPVAFCAGEALLRRPKGAWRGMLAAAAVFVVAAGLLWHWFGTVVPHSMVAKQIVYDLPRRAVTRDLLTAILASPAWLWGGALCIGLWLASRAVAATRPSAENRALLRRATALAGGGVTILLAYWWKRVFLHPWYEPLFELPILLGVFLLAFRGGARDWRRWPAPAALTAKPLAAVAIYAIGSFGVLSILPVGQPGARVQRYLQVASALALVFPDATLVSTEIGGLGYGFPGRVEDGLGLVTPAALEFHPLEVGMQRSDPHIGGLPAAYVAKATPELIVAYPYFTEDFGASPVAHNYARLSVPPASAANLRRLGTTSIRGADRLFIFIRRDLATPTALQTFEREFLTSEREAR